MQPTTPRSFVRGWGNDLRRLAVECGALFVALFVSAGLVYGAHVATKPDRPAPLWRVRIAELERENLALRVQLDELRRAEGKPFVAGETNIPATALPTK